MQSNPEIDRLLKVDDKLPPVHPHLIEHLRKAFTLTLPHDLYTPQAEHALAWVSQRQGEQRVIDYLATLVNPGQGFPEEETYHELPGTEADESSGTDPRRPGSRERG